MNNKMIELLEELQRDYDNAVADGNNALASQLDMQINCLMEFAEEEDEENEET